MRFYAVTSFSIPTEQYRKLYNNNKSITTGEGESHEIKRQKVELINHNTCLTEMEVDVDT